LSPLTKLFVVLLVVLSLLMTASVVVFVNRVEDYKATADTMKAQVDQANREAQQQVNDAAAQRAQADSNAKAAESRLLAMNQTMIQAQQQLADKSAQVAEQARQLALQSLDVNRLTEALRASEAQKVQLNQSATALRTENDRLIRQATELNAALSDKTNQLDVTERDRRYLAEQLTEAQNTSARATAQLKDLGVRAGETSSGLKGGAPAINAVVKDVAPVNGVRYATISVGTAADVQKGMQFNVIDTNSGTFLGILTVDNVEQNEAAGPLKGPHVDQIKQGNQARTQL
jgi:chromosome segregation ATPase